MKLLNLIALITLCSCINVNSSSQKDIFLSQFFNNEVVYNGLSKYYPHKSIVIYDKENLLVKVSKTYGDISKSIKIETLKPLTEEYFVIYSFTMNKNLISLVLATSDMEQGVIYYLKRNKMNEKWTIMNIIPKSSR